MRKLFLALGVLFIFTGCFAETVEAEASAINAEIIINSDLSVTERVNVEVVNSHSSNSSYSYIFLSDIPSSFELVDENGTQINYTSFVANGVFTIRVLDEIKPNASKVYTITYSNNEVIQELEKNNIFSYSFTSYYDLNDFILKLVLPKAFGITKKEANTVSPPTSRLYSDGQQIIIEWIDDVGYLETNTYLVFFEEMAFTNFSITWLLTTALTGLLTGGVLVFYVMKKKRKDIVTMALSEDEKSVVDFVLEEGNNVYQGRIGEGLDFSKPKVSKLVHNLKDKNILRVERDGRRNKIKINEEIL